MRPAVVLTAAPAAVLSKRLRVVTRAASWSAHPFAVAPMRRRASRRRRRHAVSRTRSIHCDPRISHNHVAVARHVA